MGRAVSGAWAEWEPRQYIGFAEEDARSLGHGRSGLHLFIVESRRGGGCQVLPVSGRPRRSPPARRTPAAPSPRPAVRPPPAPPPPRPPLPPPPRPAGRARPTGRPPPRP